MAVMIKITTAPVLLLLPVAAYAVTGSDRSRMVQLLREPVLICLFVVGIAWMAGGLISSGCVAFPVASSCIAALPWTPPIADIHQFAALVTAWARSPNEHFQEAATGWEWLRDWPSMMLVDRVFIPGASWSFAIAAGVGIGIALVDRYIFKAKRPDRAGGAGMGMIGYAILTACLGNLFWFLAAPDPRFGIGFLLALPALAVAAGTQALSVGGPAIRFVVGRCVLVVFVFVCAGLIVKDLRIVAFSAAKAGPRFPMFPSRRRISVRLSASTSRSPAINAGMRPGPAPRVEDRRQCLSPSTSSCYGTSSNRQAPRPNREKEKRCDRLAGRKSPAHKIPAQSKDRLMPSSLARPAPLAAALLLLLSLYRPAMAEDAPSPAEARAFVEKAEADLARESEYLGHVEWVQNTYITDDTNWLVARANGEQTDLSVRYAKEAARFDRWRSIR